MISVRKINSSTGNEYVVFCNGKQTPIDQIGNAVAEFFDDGTNMHSATVHIAAEENIPMGVITDIKEQLRNARALKVRYETHESTIEKRLPPAPKTDLFTAAEDAIVGVNRRNIIVMRVNSKKSL